MFKSIGINDNLIFIDIDDTICNTRESVKEIYQKITNDTKGGIYTGIKDYKSFCSKWSDKDIDNLFKYGSRTIYKEATPIPGSIESIKHLQKIGFDVRLVSLSYSESVFYKQEWVDRYFPSLSDKVYICTNTKDTKEVFAGFSIIDDNLDNIKNNRSIYPILLDVHNCYEHINYQHKFNSWKNLIDKF